MTQSKIKKRLLLLLPIIVFFLFSLHTTFAQGTLPCLSKSAKGPPAPGQVWCDDFGLGSAASGTGVIQSDIPIVIARVVQGVLGIVGVIFLILIIWGGVMWMTSGGNEQRVTTAKKILTTATIGLIIIVTGYSITYFIVQNLAGQAVNSIPGSGGGL